MALKYNSKSAVTAATIAAISILPLTCLVRGQVTLTPAELQELKPIHTSAGPAANLSTFIRPVLEPIQQPARTPLERAVPIALWIIGGFYSVALPWTLYTAHSALKEAKSDEKSRR